MISNIRIQPTSRKAREFETRAPGISASFNRRSENSCLDILQLYGCTSYRSKRRQKEMRRHRSPRQLVRNARLALSEAVLLQPLGQLLIGQIGALEAVCRGYNIAEYTRDRIQQ